MFTKPQQMVGPGGCFEYLQTIGNAWSKLFDICHQIRQIRWVQVSADVIERIERRQ